MKKVLIVGFGNHAKRRILPALQSIEEIDEIAITSKSKLNNSKYDDMYLSKSDILSSKKLFDTTIISSYPNVHIENLKQFRNQSESFLIEKPITNDLSYLESQEYFKYHQNNKARESLMYFHHPIYEAFKKILSNNEVVNISASFKVPPVDPNNFRYSKVLGGSSILDQGIYPISLILENFKIRENSIKNNIIFQKNIDIDVGGSLTCMSENAVQIDLSWGIGYEYSNFVELKSKNTVFTFPMFFSKPENFESFYNVSSDGENEDVPVGNFNQFQIMYEDIILNQKEFAYNSYDNLCKRYGFIRKLLND